jgi:hypothetical protein
VVSYGITVLRDEADLQARIGTLATRVHGLLHYHTHDSRRSTSGFPDSVFVGRTVLFRELKMTRRSKISQAQKDWLARLTLAGADAGIWYAEDYHSGLVDEQLRDAAPRDPRLQKRRVQPPMAMRLAKRLYLKTSDNQARAALLWEAGVASVEHGRWLARAHEILAIVAAELPAGEDEHLDWLAAHTLTHRAGAAAILQAVKSDLTAQAEASQLLAEPDSRR